MSCISMQHFFCLALLAEGSALWTYNSEAQRSCYQVGSGWNSFMPSDYFILINMSPILRHHLKMANIPLKGTIKLNCHIPYTRVRTYVMITYVSKENNRGQDDKIRYICGLKGPIFIL